MVANDVLAAERFSTCEPSSELLDERVSLILICFEECEECPAMGQLFQCFSTDQLDQSCSEESVVQALREVRQSGIEHRSPVWGDAL